ncbi:hypothetical protein RNH54_005665 [Raoultella planticola]|nr:hypothetical protein [Raoultella planticola]
MVGRLPSVQSRQRGEAQELHREVDSQLQVNRVSRPEANLVPEVAGIW